MRIVFRVLMIAAVFAVVAARPAMAQGDAEKGKAVYAAQKCSMCHAIAGVGGKASPLDGVGKKLSEADIRAWIVTPKEMTAKDQVDEEAADGRPLFEAAGGRHRRAGRLHGQPEVGTMLSDRASVRHPVTLVGVVITTVAAVAFLTLVAADMFGMFTNPYAGLVIFIAVPALFVLGLLLIPMGIWLQRRALRRDPSASTDWPVIDLRRSRVRTTVLVLTAMTVVNATLVLLAAQGSLHYMESSEFCGASCHTPMHPQFTAWQNTTHAEVDCVKCHIGDGARALVHYKLAGVRQLVHVISGNYPRPIPASQAVLRPALETCGTCHSPTLGHGERTRTFREYAEDEKNTETATTLTHARGWAESEDRVRPRHPLARRPERAHRIHYDR